MEDRFFKTTDPKELAYALPRDDLGPPSLLVKLMMSWGTESWVNLLADYSTDLFRCRYTVEDSWDSSQKPPR